MADGIQSFRDFVESLIRARYEDFAARPEAKVASPEHFEEMRQHVLGLYAGVEAQHSFLELGGRPVDCIPIEQQPSLRNSGPPVAPPSGPPPLASDAASGELPTGEPARQLHPEWKDRYGNAMWCPQGTIPMLRITLEQVTRFRTLRDFFSKAPGGGRHPRFGGPRSAAKHKWANAYQNIANVGGASAIQICMPATGTTTYDFSLSQQWHAAGSDATLQTVEGGWMVYPDFFQTASPCLFIYWTADNYGGQGCYNLTCSAFVQINNLYVLGGALPYAPGIRSHIYMGWWLQNNCWWLNIAPQGGDQFTAIGYYPVSIFQNGLMATGAQDIDFGGETSALTSWPPMGNGEFASSNSPAWQQNLAYYTGNTGQWAQVTPRQLSSNCYTIEVSTVGGPGGPPCIYYGGPGGTDCF